jgi:hypothetical protein
MVLLFNMVTLAGNSQRGSPFIKKLRPRTPPKGSIDLKKTGHPLNIAQLST